MNHLLADLISSRTERTIAQSPLATAAHVALVMASEIEATTASLSIRTPIGNPIGKWWSSKREQTVLPVVPSCGVAGEPRGLGFGYQGTRRERDFQANCPIRGSGAGPGVH